MFACGVTRLASSEHISCPGGFGFEYLALNSDAAFCRPEKRGDGTGRHFGGEFAAESKRRRVDGMLIVREF